MKASEAVSILYSASVEPKLLQNLPEALKAWENELSGSRLAYRVTLAMGHLAIELTSPNHVELSYNIANRRRVLLDHDRRTYATLDSAELPQGRGSSRTSFRIRPTGARQVVRIGDKRLQTHEEHLDVPGVACSLWLLDRLPVPLNECRQFWRQLFPWLAADALPEQLPYEITLHGRGSATAPAIHLV